MNMIKETDKTIKYDFNIPPQFYLSSKILPKMNAKTVTHSASA